MRNANSQLYRRQERSRIYRASAQHCRLKAAASQRPDVRLTYKELADRWDEMARQAEQRGPE